MNLNTFLNNKQFLSLTGNVIMALLNIVTIGLLYRHMTQEDIGLWFFFQVSFTLIDTFRTGFLQTAFIRFFTGTNKEQADNILGSTWYLGLLITAILLLLTIPGFFLLRFITVPGLIVLIKWAGVTFIATLPIAISTWILQARQRYKEILYIRLVNQASFIIFVLVAIRHQNTSINLMLIGNLASCVLTCVFVFAFGWSGISTLPKKTSLRVKEIYHFGKFSIGSSISSNLLRSSDVFIINFALGPASVAIYSVAQSLMNIIDIPLRSFITTALPSLSAAQNSNRKEEVIYIFKKYTGMLTIAFIPVIIAGIVFADIAIKIIGGNDYAHTPAANIFRIFMIFAVFSPVDKFTGVTLDVIARPKLNFYKVLIMLAVNVTGDFTGIYFMHNVYGVALASIPTFIIGTLLGYIFLKRFLNFNLGQIFRLGYVEVTLLSKKLGLHTKN